MDNNSIEPLPKNFIERFISLEAFSGLILIFALLLALIVNNTPLHTLYEGMINMRIDLRIGYLEIKKPFVLWLNDGLMAVFFMLLALEMKREIIEGELSSFKQLRLPLIGAIGGIVVPGLIYWLFNRHNPATVGGWPIPITTDVAFVLGVIALLGKSIPSSLRIMMVALSIVDDVLAILIIAVVYTNQLSTLSLIVGAMAIILLFVINRCKVQQLTAYMLLGVVIWIAVLKSGVHATLAGVIVGLFIPMTSNNPNYSPLKTLEHTLHPWVAYVILPLFVFCNGGLPFKDMQLGHLADPVSLGIMAGLVVGKCIGVFGFSATCIRLGWCTMPTEATYRHLLGFSMLTGIGFTMSLFLSSLAFTGTAYEDIAKQSILLASLLSGLLAVAIFHFKRK